jgi:hypothetical protein
MIIEMDAFDAVLKYDVTVYRPQLIEIATNFH